MYADPSVKPLSGKITLVTGASRGVGRGIARGFGEAGATVYVTGRTVQRGPTPEAGTIESVAAEVDALGGKGIPVRCDHTRDEEIRALFARIEAEAGRLDVLVNNVHSGVYDMAEGVDRRFWEIEPGDWDRMNDAGLRGHYVASVYAARLMTRQRGGLILNVSSFGAITYLFNVAYGVGKAALDRMTVDMAIELKNEGVAVVSIWPGLVRTELTEQLMDEATPGYRRIFEAYGESTMVTGRAAAVLAARPDNLRRTGRVLIAAEVMRSAGLRDECGRKPCSPRSLRSFAKALFPERWRGLARLVPHVTFPFWVARPVVRKFTEFLKENGGFRGDRLAPR
jgi:NAD(P)-dependent dehydrogenase (short-subunit alcohol dehydrogenase family)